MKLCATSFDPAANRTMPVHRGLCPNRPWRTSPTPGSRSRTGTSVQGRTSSDRQREAKRPGARLIECSMPMSHDHGTSRFCSTAASNCSRPALTRHDADGAGAVLVDATLGAGGHAERFLHRPARPAADRARPRPDALQIAGERLAPFGDRVTRSAPATTGSTVLAESGYAASNVDGVLFDLGVSSMQLDRTERGFSYAARRPAGHADGSGRAADRRRHPQHLRREDADADPARVRRGAVRHRGSPPRSCGVGAATVHHHRRAGRAALRGDPGAGPAHRRSSRQAHLPGAAHRGQRRTGFAARRPARRAGRAGCPAGGSW